VKTKEEPIDVVELGQEELDHLLAQVQTALPEQDFAKIRRVVTAYQYLLKLIEKKNITLDRLKKIIFGSGSEKSSEVFKEQPEDSSSAPDGTMPEQKRKGHGRNGVAAYTISKTGRCLPRLPAWQGIPLHPRLAGANYRASAD
jgi:hypothetical protein